MLQPPNPAESGPDANPETRNSKKTSPYSKKTRLYD